MLKMISVVLVFVVTFFFGCGGKEEDKVVREPEIAQKAPKALSEEPDSEKVEPAAEVKPKPQTPVPEKLGPRYVIQLAAWEKLEDAVWMADWLVSIGYDVWVETSYIPAKAREYHRVRTGDFHNYRDAKEEAIRISGRIGSDYWVVRLN
jgi:cell division septation protein DedD